MENTATYSPEDNKLRLYVGRVPREEYLKLRAEGWTSTPKQSCDFVATWTPARRDTCLQYADLIEDEDQGPQDRAADRAERFGEYRDKRTTEATGHADRYDAGPSAHGFQSAARAERSARRHDRIGTHATDAWSKAEYWQQRTAGVISHALYVSSPDVRMGRIKTLEAELRTRNPGGEWHAHLTLRLAYENQMLEAQGGRAAHVEMVAGGFLGSRQIFKVNKSAVTGRVVSVLVKGPQVHSWTYKAHNVSGTDYALYQIETERLAADVYRAPTPEELTAFEVDKKARKAAAPKKEKCPLINPTDADAERLQNLWNERAKARHIESHVRQYGKDWLSDFEPATVCRVTQATYSAVSKGVYGRASTERIEAGGKQVSGYANHQRLGNPVCLLRTTSANNGKHFTPHRVIVLNDKPQKPLPVSVWETIAEPVTA